MQKYKSRAGRHKIIYNYTGEKESLHVLGHHMQAFFSAFYQ